MAISEANLAERSGSLVESHKSYDPRIALFYLLLAALLLTLAGGLAYQQLLKSDVHSQAERQQSQRRVIVPGPRGNIYDREGRLLVGNRAVFSVVLYVDELRAELLREYRLIYKNYAATTDDRKEIPAGDDLWLLARTSVAQKYLDQVNAILGAHEKIDARKLAQHFNRQLLLPYPLIADLSREDFAKLLERLPINSPLQVYCSNSRYYPYGSAAAHTLGFVRIDNEAETADFPGAGLHTIPMKGSVGRDGLEKQYDAVLQGTPGGAIFRVDKDGYRIDPPLEERAPKQGKSLTTSLDIDLQTIAEEGLGDQRGAAVAIEVATGEVLVLASKPDYDLAQFSPRASQEIVDKINETGAWENYAVTAGLPPGSTFKILTSIAAMRRGGVQPDKPIVDCQAWYRVGNRPFPCYNGRERHGEIHLQDAIAESCDIFFYKAGELATPDGLAEEAHRFGLDRPTGIDLPYEPARMLVPNQKWKRETYDQPWYPGDTANMAIGQGYVQVSPLGMACFMASLARGETVTVPTLLHDQSRPQRHGEPIGLTREQLAAIVAGMEGCTTYGTAKLLNTTPGYKIPGVRIAGKTGTAQKRVVKDEKEGTINYAWFVCFAPVAKPEIALAIVMEGDVVGEEFGGGRHAAPIASLILQKYFAKKANPNGPPVMPFKTL